MDVKKEIIKRLSDSYSACGKSFSELEKITKIPRSTIQRIVTGQMKNMDIDKIKAIAEACGVSAEYVMGWENYCTKNIIPLPETDDIPLLGVIACGNPILADENVVDFIKCPKKYGATFALTCKGDSMINARIFDGDVVFIRQQPDVDDGQIAAVLIGEEATLKRVRKFPNKIVLSPCNPMYDDLVYQGEQLADIRILGKAVGFTSLIK